MQTYKFILGFLILGSFLTACTSQKGPKAYARWCQESVPDLMTTSQGDIYTYQWGYTPTPCNILRSEGIHLNPQQYTHLLDDASGVEYYQLTIYSQNEGVAQAQDASFWAFEFPQNLRLVAGNDTLKCSLYHLVSDGGLGGGKTCLMAFDMGSSPIGDRTLIIDGERWGAQTRTLTLSDDTFQQVPTLKI